MTHEQYHDLTVLYNKANSIKSKIIACQDKIERAKLRLKNANPGDVKYFQEIVDLESAKREKLNNEFLLLEVKI